MYPIYYIYYIIKLLNTAILKLPKAKMWAKAYVKQLEVSFNGKFDDQLIQKVAKYQSIQLLFVANNFSKLYGRFNNDVEKERNLLFFLMSVLYDEIIDNQQMEEAELNELFYHSAQVNHENFNVKVLVYIHQKLLNQVSNKESYWDTIQKTHQAQVDSRNQFNSNISLNEIIDITKRKGGYTLLMCRHYLVDPVDEKIDQCWYQLGGLIQMTNDLYDTHKDTLDGIHTFATHIKNFDTLNEVYEQQVNNFNTSINQLSCSIDKKIEFGINMSMIASFGYVAINQLKHLKSGSNTLPNFKEVNRKDLIIDMEKIKNIFKLIHFSYKQGKLWM